MRRLAFLTAVLALEVVTPTGPAAADPPEHYEGRSLS
jgi:hypothetical protein